MMEFSGERSSWLNIARNFFNVSLASCVFCVCDRAHILHPELVDEALTAVSVGNIVADERISDSPANAGSLMVTTSITPCSSCCTRRERR
jgi:hypothetical protein